MAAHAAEPSISEPTSILSYLLTSLTLLLLAALIQADSDRLLTLGRSSMQLATTILDVILINNVPQSPQPTLSAGQRPPVGGGPRKQARSQSQPTSPKNNKKSRKNSKKVVKDTKERKAQPVNIPTPASRPAQRPQHTPIPSSSYSSTSSLDVTGQSSVVSLPLSSTTSPALEPTSPPIPSSAPEADPGASRPPPNNRSLSQSLLKSILNPRAAAYEYRARYLPSADAPATQSLADDPAAHTFSSSSLASTIAPVSTFGAPQPDITSAPFNDAPSHTDKMPSPTPQRKKAKQPYDYLLVLDVEATCAQGAGFDYPNEIIEWPVVLMKWTDKDEEGRASELTIVDEFRSFVRPTWRTQLSEFCTSLTGITQADIDAAPSFTEVLSEFESFLQKHNLVPPPVALLTPPSSRCPSPAPTEAHDSVQTSSSLSSSPSTSFGSRSICSSPNTSPPFSPAWSTSSLPNSPPNPYSFSALGIDGEGSPLSYPTPMGEIEPADASWDSGYEYPRFAWATDGPFDLRDFLVKQCFISKIPIPHYFLQDNVIDVRKVVGSWVAQGGDAVPAFNPSSKDTTQAAPRRFTHQKRVSLNIPLQLQALSLGSFAGRQHSGIDDARNIGRIIQALAQRSVRLEANTYIQPNRRWYWMGEYGQVILPPSELLTSA